VQPEAIRTDFPGLSTGKIGHPQPGAIDRLQTLNKN
jgi:hypothetical protein